MGNLKLTKVSFFKDSVFSSLEFWLLYVLTLTSKASTHLMKCGYSCLLRNFTEGQTLTFLKILLWKFQEMEMKRTSKTKRKIYKIHYAVFL
jgi:hypothetical protein